MNKTQIEELISSLVILNDNDLKLKEIVDIYLQRTKALRSYGTFEYYLNNGTHILKTLASFGVKNLSELTTHALHRYIAYEKSRGLKNNTVNKRLEVLQLSLTHCHKNGIISSNPMQFFEKLMSDDVETKIIDENYLIEIFEHINSQPITPRNLRSKMILYILLETGIRVSELRHIKLDNLDLMNNRIYLTYTKTHEHRTVFISDLTADIIRSYIELVDPQEYLVISLQSGGQIGRQTIYKFMSEIKKKLNIPDEVSISFHKWRHTFATMCLAEGANLEFVRRVLGHKNLSTTQRYLHLNDQKLAEAHEKYNPLAQLSLI